MYYAHRAAGISWAGEPETDPVVEEGGKVEGVELLPMDALEAAYRGVMLEPGVAAGERATRCPTWTNC
jgi:hypothetical protein